MGIILLQYVDDLLTVGINDDIIIKKFKKDLATGKENFVFSDGGTLEALQMANPYY